MLAGVLGTALLGALAVFQVLLVAGAPLGRLAWGGRHVVLPAGLRVGSAVTVLLYGGIALVLLQRAGASSALPDGLTGVLIWVLTGWFTVGIVMNAASRSRPERLVMTPVVLVLTVICLVLALQ